MTFTTARALLRDPYYARLAKDLQRGTRKRRIGFERMARVLAVQRPERVVRAARYSAITQAQHDRAHEIAEEIASSLHGERLQYDSPKPLVLPGHYGKNQ